MAEINREILDDPDMFSSIDSGGMLNLIDKLPQMLEEGWTKTESQITSRLGKLNSLVISGMGGSAISGDIAAYVLKSKADFPVIVNRSYNCPRFVDASTLFLAVSYSGNTEETISAFKEAVQKKARIISITSGGEIRELSKKNNVQCIEIPGGLPPRAALGYLLSSVLSVLGKTDAGAGIRTELPETVKLLKQLSKKYSSHSPIRENDAKLLAAKIFGKLPVILASENTTYPAGLRWKTQLNENSKATAIIASFPEFNHNDMVNFSSVKAGENDFSFIILRDEGDPERMKKRIEITKSLISGYVGGVTEIWSQGKSALERLLSLILLGDYLSVYLAVLKGLDPTPVDIIEKLKKELAR